MAILPRESQKVFGSTGGTGEFGQIGSKAAGVPVTTKNIETMQSLSQFDQGLNAIVSDQGTSVLPYLEDLNSLFFLTTSQLAYLFQSGVPEWNDETEYYQDISIVLKGGVLWVDIYGTGGTPNFNFDPLINLDKWRPISLDSFLSDSGSANSYVLTQASGSAPTQYLDGEKVTFKAVASNTGASTINSNGRGVKGLVYPDGGVLQAGDIEAGEYVDAIYNLSDDRFELVYSSISQKRMGLAPGVVVEWNAPNDPSTYGIRGLPLNNQGILVANYPSLVSRNYVGDANNAVAAAAGGGYFRADDAAGTIPNITGIYFILPESRGYGVRGLDLAASVDPDGASRTIGDNQADAMQRITASVDAVKIGGGLAVDAVTEGAFNVETGSFTGNSGISGSSLKINFNSADSASPNLAKTNDVETRMSNRSTKFIMIF